MACFLPAVSLRPIIPNLQCAFPMLLDPQPSRGFLRYWAVSSQSKIMFFPGDNSREDLHTPNCGECRRCQVRLYPFLPESQTPQCLCPEPTHLLCFRDAIAKVLYALLFGWLITRVNALVSPKHDTLSIAILDIYGFEVALRGTSLLGSYSARLTGDSV